MISILLLSVLLLSSTSSQKIINSNNPTENILCRHCGKEISTSNSIIFKTSAAPLYAFNDTLFNRNDVLVQVLLKDFIFRLPIITSSHSTCIAKGEWERELWFSGYSWKPCFCECGALVGWIFENQFANIGDMFFYGLILTNLIGENWSFLGSVYNRILLPMQNFRYRFPLDIPRQCIVAMDSDGLSAEEKEFLAKCEEEFKDRFTEKDEEFIKVFNRPPSTPPIVENWWSPNNYRRNDRRYNNRFNNHSYNRYRNRDRQGRGDYNSLKRSNDSRGYNDESSSDSYKRPRY